MRRTLAVATLFLFLLGTMPGPAWATSGAHFFNDTSASIDSTTGGLVIHIDEGGVGQVLVDYTISGTATVTYQCFNNGGKHPKAGNKETSSSPIVATFSFSPTNGRVQETFTVTGTPGAPANGFSCPSGQSLYLQAVSYSVSLTDTTNNAGPVTLTASDNNLHLLIS